MTIEKTYQRLTRVDLEEQKRIWDERGKGYYGEFCVFKKLLTQMHGNCKFLMNLNIPAGSGKTTEIDLIMVHDTGLYVFEIKHYKGTIYGNTDDAVWTQFFRTTKNSVFESPVHQNGYHIRALKTLFPDKPIHSVVVFSNEECTVKVENSNSYLVITTISNLISDLCAYSGKQNRLLTLDEIEHIYAKLEPYSPIIDAQMSEESAAIVSIGRYLGELRIANEEAIRETEKKAKERIRLAEEAQKETEKRADERVCNFIKWDRENKKKWWRSLIATVIVIVICSVFICRQYEEETRVAQEAYEEKTRAAQEALEQMQKNFEHVEVYNGGHLDFKSDFIDVTEIQLKASPDLENTVLFSCELTNTGKDYGIMFNKDTKYIVMLEDGTVKEYDMFGERLNYNSGSQRLGGSASKGWYNQSAELKPLEIYNIDDISKITYIKITNVSIWKYGENGNNSIADGYQLQVYTK